MVKAFIQMDDSDITLDLRRSNGSAKSATFDAFWIEFQAYLDEITLAVDVRWHGEALHMLFTVSLCHLPNLIAERLAKKFQEDMPALPSLEWICIQFWPSNPYTEQALRYTGCFLV